MPRDEEPSTLETFNGDEGDDCGESTDVDDDKEEEEEEEDVVMNTSSKIRLKAGVRIIVVSMAAILFPAWARMLSFNDILRP